VVGLPLGPAIGQASCWLPAEGFDGLYGTQGARDRAVSPLSRFRDSRR
jgi:hypothetical protein